MTSNYDKFPYVAITSNSADCQAGWQAITREIAKAMPQQATICVECYPGVFEDEIEKAVRDVFPQAEIILSRDYLKSANQLQSIVAPELTPDPVFGWLTRLDISDFFC